MDIGTLPHIEIEWIKIGHHVSEVYSPPRINVTAAKIGLVPGMSLDLTQLDPHDGLPWDFTKAEKKDKTPIPVTPFSAKGRALGRFRDPGRVPKSNQNSHQKIYMKNAEKWRSMMKLVQFSTREM